MRRRLTIVLLAAIVAAGPALANPPDPAPKPPNPQEQAALDLERLKAEREARLTQVQETFQERVTEATKARDAAVAKARERHDAAVAATRAWYDQRRTELEAVAKGAAD